MAWFKRNKDQPSRPHLSPRIQPVDIEEFEEHFRLKPFEAEREDLVGRGLVLYESETSYSIPHRDAIWETERAETIDVVGESNYLEALASDAVAGKPVRIVPDPTNTYDPGALEVRDDSGRHLAGFIGRGDQQRVHKMLASNDTVVLAMWSWYRKDSGQRVNLRLLFARAGVLEEPQYRIVHPLL